MYIYIYIILFYLLKIIKKLIDLYKIAKNCF